MAPTPPRDPTPTVFAPSPPRSTQPSSVTPMAGSQEGRPVRYRHGRGAAGTLDRATATLPARCGTAAARPAHARAFVAALPDDIAPLAIAVASCTPIGGTS